MGIEIEYWLIDERGQLASVDEIVAACDGVEPEMTTKLLEVKTPPCESVEELMSSLTDRLTTVVAQARSRNLRLVPLGTPLGSPTLPHRDGTRIAVQEAVLGDAFKHAGYCAGTHLHFEQDRPLDQLRVLTALDPAFTLVNTTPYYHAQRVARCARPHVYRRRCYQALPGHGQLWRYPESLMEWRERIHDRFETFVDTAAEQGIDREQVYRTFTPADAIWSPVCLRDDLGTVEWRTPDAAPPLDLYRLVTDVVQILTDAVEAGTQVLGSAEAPQNTDQMTLPAFETVQSHVDLAIEEGRNSTAVSRYLADQGFDLNTYQPLASGIDIHRPLSPEMVRRLRCRAADRFERDLTRLQAATEIL